MIMYNSESRSSYRGLSTKLPKGKYGAIYWEPGWILLDPPNHLKAGLHPSLEDIELTEMTQRTGSTK